MENDVKNDSVVTEPTTAKEVTAVVPGTKTDSALLLESLKEEREKRRSLEAQVAEKEAELLALKNTSGTDEIVSDEGRVLQNQISELNKKLSVRENQDLLASVESRFPQLKDKKLEFEQFRLENVGMKLETQAKAFLVENDLLETPRVRQGLERASGGGRVPTPTGITQEEINDIRLNNPRKFRDMLKSGQIK